LDDLTTSVRYDEEQNILYGYNEKLRPYSAYNLDIAWEEYASDNNRFAINAFSKFLDDYIVYVNETKPVSELAAYNGSISFPDAGEVTLVSAKNAEQSWLYGIETSAEIDMTWPGNPQNHFGVVGIVSYTRGKVRYYNTDTGELLSVKGLPFLSPWLANLTTYWESYDLSVRLSVTYRDDYIARVDSRTLQDEDETGFEDSMYVDAVVAWHIGDKWEVRFEATNLTNQREIQYSDSAHRPYNTAVSGRDYYVGITYRY
jgi:outer membrane receptor protein involved in Fe transport